MSESLMPKPDKKRRAVANQAPWGQGMKYSRALRIGDTIEVSGTTAVNPEGEIISRGDVAGQARACFLIIQKSLEDLDSCLEDIVRTRLFVTDVKTWRVVGAVHDEILGHVAPVSSLVGVNALLHPDLLIAIEATAIVGSATVLVTSTSPKKDV